MKAPWTKPQLIVFARAYAQETVLANCKTGPLGDGSSSGNAQYSCKKMPAGICAGCKGIWTS
jgi:hypothetical protein